MPIITNILASGTTAAPSTTVVLDQGESNTFIMRGTGGLEIQILADDGEWVQFGSLSRSEPVRQLFGPGSYRAVRNEGPVTAADSVA